MRGHSSITLHLNENSNQHLETWLLIQCHDTGRLDGATQSIAPQRVRQHLSTPSQSKSPRHRSLHSQAPSETAGHSPRLGQQPVSSWSLCCCRAVRTSVTARTQAVPPHTVLQHSLAPGHSECSLQVGEHCLRATAGGHEPDTAAASTWNASSRVSRQHAVRDMTARSLILRTEMAHPVCVAAYGKLCTHELQWGSLCT